MINYRIYQYTSIARPPDPSETAMRVIAYLLPVAAVLGAALGWAGIALIAKATRFNTVRPEMHIRYCARLFENFGIGHAPVEENGKIIGMVSYYRLVLYGLKDLIDD